MIDRERVLGVIAARGGSKGLPGKNVLELGSKPMIAWSIEAAGKSALLDRTVVSTDDPLIADIALRYKGDVPFVRPAHLATDTAAIVDTVLHAAETIGGGYSHVVLLQTTSPLRLAVDIDGTIARLRRSKASSCVSVTEVTKGPNWMFFLDQNEKLRPIIGGKSIDRRQDLPIVYQPNGAVYAAELEFLRKTRSFYSSETVGYVMPPERSIDIDSEIDFLLARTILEELKRP